MALSKDQISCSVSDTVSFAECSATLSECDIGVTLVVFAGCNVDGTSATCGVCLFLLYLP